MSRPRRPRPTLADLSIEGPALSPADFAAIIGISRELVADMCRNGEVGAFRVGTAQQRHWKIPRSVCLEYCRRLRLTSPAA